MYEKTHCLTGFWPFNKTGGGGNNNLITSIGKILWKSVRDSLFPSTINSTVQVSLHRCILSTSTVLFEWNLPRERLRACCSRARESKTRVNCHIKAVEDLAKSWFFTNNLILQWVFREFSHTFSFLYKILNRKYFVTDTRKFDEISLTFHRLWSCWGALQRWPMRI